MSNLHQLIFFFSLISPHLRPTRVCCSGTNFLHTQESRPLEQMTKSHLQEDVLIYDVSRDRPQIRYRGVVIYFVFDGYVGMNKIPTD